MKKRYLTAGLAAALICSVSLSSCIGSFRLTNSVLKWNNQVGSKFVNEIVFFAFWILPVYEVTSVADLLVLNSIEFWSGRNPLTASTKIVETHDATYLIACDGKGYTVTNRSTQESFRIDFIEETRTWALNIDGEMHPFMTFIDDTRVRAITPCGDFRTIDLTEDGVAGYRAEVTEAKPATENMFLAMN